MSGNSTIPSDAAFDRYYLPRCECGEPVDERGASCYSCQIADDADEAEEGDE